MLVKVIGLGESPSNRHFCCRVDGVVESLISSLVSVPIKVYTTAASIKPYIVVIYATLDVKWVSSGSSLFLLNPSKMHRPEITVF